MSVMIENSVGEYTSKTILSLYVKKNRFESDDGSYIH